MAQGENFRSSEADRAAIASVIPRKEASWEENRWRTMIESQAGLEGMHWEDLYALNRWTGAAYRDIQDLFESDRPECSDASDKDGAEADRHGFILAKGVISALNTLPDQFTFLGTVYTGEDLPRDWIKRNFVAGQTKVEKRFFATSESHEMAWQHKRVIFETHSRSGKCIAQFSNAPGEKEVLFRPGTRFRVDEVSDVAYPAEAAAFARNATVRIRQTEL
ncbi:MAG TPA: ADP-ribosyltransferase [Methylibium sp.]|uniref:ADP-ribosyltransferase n=1 Tax=Methylibium sp. TaxID=2067992 RepID=UPI002DB99BFA|nr:ADP-ribosyltransferase [Methylibium sp.]HEU4458616.1 ADP-ribosyltransferase [Methylibium sp.]